MPGFDIQSFKSNFDGGARAYLFYYYPNIPNSLLGEKISYLVKTATLPGSTLEEHTAAWQGNTFKFSGKHTFEDWTINFNVDPDAKIRIDFENWQRQKIHDPVSNKYGAITEYMRDQQLQLLGYDGEYVLEVTLYNAWPKTIGALSLDYASSDTLAFDVTFAYTHYTMKRQDNATL